MLPTNGIKIVFGTGSIGDASDPLVGFSTPDQTQEVLDIFRAHGGNELDSARMYSPNAPGTSEGLVGQTDAREWATLSTKVWSRPGDHTTAGIEKSVRESLEALKVSSVDIDYLHLPDPDTPLEETIAAMDAAYRAGKFKHFGISNYNLKQVREILSICETKGYNKPSVYQGQYNAVVRGAEKAMLPLLRENGIKFYAWSPAASGILSGKSQKLTGDDPISKLFTSFYDKPELKTALQRLQDDAESHGINGHAVALRWVLHHSGLKGELGDAMVIGARTVNQMNSSMEILSAGPLPKDLVDLVEEIWSTIEKVAPSYAGFNSD